MTRIWEQGQVRTIRSGEFWLAGERVVVDGRTYQRGAMYVAWQAPAHVTRPYPVVLVHGGAVQGTEWRTTPDGRPGWADRLVDAGYAVFVVDRPTQGRSPLHADVDGPVGPAFSYEEGEQVFFPSATRAAHTQWPIEDGDSSRLDEFIAAYGPLPVDIETWQRLDTARLADLVDRLGPCVVFTHSASGSDGWLLADARPGLVGAIVSVEPMGPPFGHTPNIGTLSWGLTAVPVGYDPPRRSPDEARAADPDTLRIPALADVPVLVVASETSPQGRYAGRMVDFLARAGARAELLDLAAEGVRGNGHGLIYEKNSDESLHLVLEWLTKVEADAAP